MLNKGFSAVVEEVFRSLTSVKIITLQSPSLEMVLKYVSTFSKM